MCNRLNDFCCNKKLYLLVYYKCIDNDNGLLRYMFEMIYEIVV